jgi:hypothetical protein
VHIVMFEQLFPIFPRDIPSPNSLVPYLCPSTNSDG